MFDESTVFNLMAGTMGACLLLMLVPWWLLLAMGVGCIFPWYKRWRFKWTKPAEVKRFIDFSNIGYGTIGEVEKMMFIGMSKDETIRWWYWRGDDGVKDYLVPQAVDNGQIYWNRKLEIKNPVLLKHLHGFMEIGNEWPDYYRMINRQIEHVKKQEKKKKKEVETVKAEPSHLPRADYADVETGPNLAATAAISAMDQTNAQLLDLQETVKELEKEIKGRCPTLDIRVEP